MKGMLTMTLDKIKMKGFIEGKYVKDESTVFFGWADNLTGENKIILLDFEKRENLKDVPQCEINIKRNDVFEAY